MALATMTLDPNAASYTDDEIVGKVNAAAANITRADSVAVAAIEESATELLLSDTERTKLGGIAEGAEVNPADLAELDAAQDTKLNGIEADAKADQTGEEIRDSVVALADADREILISRPAIGEHKVYALHRLTDESLEVEFDDVPEA